MTSFGWKRKVGEKVSREKSEVFEKDAKDDAEQTELMIQDGRIDWLTLAQKQNKVLILEDAIAKSNRLADEGMVLATDERFWEAINKWNEGIELNPKNEKLYEMKAQALLQLNELYPALQSAEKVVKLNPCWWVGYQTLARTLLGLGEVSIAIKNFSKAIHINPADKELWEEDLHWACELRERSTKLQQEVQAAQQRTVAKIVDLDSPEQDENTGQVKVYEAKPGEPGEPESSTSIRVHSVPSNYVQLRR